MIKRGMAILFVFFANFIILAHAMVPHHHHETEVCIVNSHCQSGTSAHEHQTSDAKHDHDNEDDKELCVLKHTIVIPNNQFRLECKCLDCKDNQTPFGGSQSLILLTETERLIPVCSTDQLHLSLTSCYSQIVNSSLGLRGPPLS